VNVPLPLQFTILGDVAKLLNDGPRFSAPQTFQGFMLDNRPLTFILDSVLPIQRGARWGGLLEVPLGPWPDSACIWWALISSRAELCGATRSWQWSSEPRSVRQFPPGEDAYSRISYNR